MVKTNQLSLSLQGKPVLCEVTVSIVKGHITSFIGASGAGKTSLLKCLAGVYSQYTGMVLFAGQELHTMTAKQRAHNVGLVFQQCHLFAHMTVLGNCVHPQVMSGVAPNCAHSHALMMLEKLGVVELAARYSHQLSGGQQQRVAIARALCLGPQVLLLDEPSSALDPCNTKLLAKILRELKASGVTIGLCSHDVGFIKEVLDHVYYVSQGSVVEYAVCDGGQTPVDGQIGAFLAH